MIFFLSYYWRRDLILVMSTHNLSFFLMLSFAQTGVTLHRTILPPSVVSELRSVPLALNIC